LDGEEKIKIGITKDWIIFPRTFLLTIMYGNENDALTAKLIHKN
jgi:hypothetical protein